METGTVSRPGGSWLDDLSSLGERLEAVEALDRLAQPAHHLVHRVLRPGPVKDALHGRWLGHPLHPFLTDLPIGFWTSAVVLDLAGGPRAERAADRLLGLGVAAALPTAAAGAADWAELFEPEQRSGFVHAAANITATALFASSWLARRSGARRRGVRLALAGAAAATVGGFIGGHLSYRRAAGVNQDAYNTGPGEWTPVDTTSAVTGTGAGATSPVEAVDAVDAVATVEARPGRAGDTDVLVVGPNDQPDHALVAACSHLGGPLGEGDVSDGCVTCPWHGSRFRLSDGQVVRGPATAPQPWLEARSREGRVEVRRPPG
ncbi:MAG: Rieske (2Fe-2S) protein [Actinobacteria bacterium]|nr:Rieske (2Fe-2S) protein [Actinomycetota bacterium]